MHLKSNVQHACRHQGRISCHYNCPFTSRHGFVWQAPTADWVLHTVLVGRVPFSLNAPWIISSCGTFIHHDAANRERFFAEQSHRRGLWVKQETPQCCSSGETTALGEVGRPAWCSVCAPWRTVSLLRCHRKCSLEEMSDMLRHTVQSECFKASACWCREREEVRGGSVRNTCCANLQVWV